ncbi:MAG: hypothetical protein ACH37Z_11435 [Anaerolineae bacterium]
MRKFLNGWRGLVVAVVLFLFAGGTAWSASGDYAAWGLPGAEWWRINSAGDFVPGVNGTRNIGSSSLKVGNISVVNIAIAGTYSTDDLGATDDLTVGDDATVGDVLNVTGLTTLNNATVNATKTASLLGPVCLGTISVSGNTTVTATCATVIRITSLSGNISVNITSPPAGKVMTIVDESGTVGINGNVTVNVTGGTINGVDNITLTNTSTVGGKFDPTTGTNVTSWKAFFPSTTTGFVYR